MGGALSLRTGPLKMSSRFLPILILLLGALFCAPRSAHADPWPFFRSHAKMYEVEFPSKPETVRSSMRVSADSVLHTEQMSLRFPAGPESAKVRPEVSYAIRMDQSFGPPIGHRETPAELEKAVKQYIDSYAAKGGKVTKLEDYPRDGYKGKTIWIDVPVGAVTQTVRINVFMHERTRIQQVTISPKDISEHYTVSQFFHSLRLYKGEIANKGEIEKDWVLHKLDEKGLFTVRMPPAAPPMLAQEPTVKTVKHHRFVGGTFLDSARNEKMIFKANLYDYGGTRIDDGVFDLFLSKYHYPEPDKALSDPLQFGDLTGVWSLIPLRYSEQEPWMEQKIVKAYYANNYFGRNYLIVLEISGSKKMLEESTLADLLMNSLTANGKKVEEIRSKKKPMSVAPKGDAPKY